MKAEVTWREFEELVNHYFNELNKGKKEAADKIESFSKHLQSRVLNTSMGQKIDLDWALLHLIMFDATSFRNYPRRFYIAADVCSLDARPTETARSTEASSTD